jgi:hypothetical protein
MYIYLRILGESSHMGIVAKAVINWYLSRDGQIALQKE